MIINNQLGQVETGPQQTKRSPQLYARLAGILYLSLAPLGMFGLMYVQLALVVPGDMTATINNLAASESVLRLSIVSGLVTQLINLILVLVLYKLLKPVNRTMAMLMVIFFLVSVPISMLNYVNQFGILILLSGADYLAAFSTEQVHGLIALFLEMFNYGMQIAGIFWGLWLFPMGYLVYKSGFLPRIIGILLMIGCFGYLFDSFAAFVFPEMHMSIAQFTFIGEILLPLWLLVKGVNVPKWEEKARTAAID